MKYIKKEIKYLLLIVIGLLPGMYIKCLYLYNQSTILCDFNELIFSSLSFMFLGSILTLVYPKSYKKLFILLSLPSFYMIFFSSLSEISNRSYLVIPMIINSVTLLVLTYIGVIIGQYKSKSSTTDIFEKTERTLFIDITNVSIGITLIINLFRLFRGIL